MLIDTDYLTKLAAKWERTASNSKCRNGNATSEELFDYARQDGITIAKKQLSQELISLVKSFEAINALVDDAQTKT